jgi:hypothetical protein
MPYALFLAMIFFREKIILEKRRLEAFQNRIFSCFFWCTFSRIFFKILHQKVRTCPPKPEQIRNISYIISCNNGDEWSWNDGETSRRFQEKLLRDDINLPDHGVLSDSAFPVNGKLFKRIMTPLKDNDLERAHPAARPALIALGNAIVSLR